MKFIHYLIYEAPGALKVSICAAFGGLGLVTNGSETLDIGYTGVWSAVGVGQVIVWEFY